MLEVAETLFMTRGYAGTSVSEISKRTRVSPRLISAHFGEKADIFAQVIRARLSRAFSLARETSAEGSLEDILFSTARFALSSAYSSDAINFVRLVVGEGKRFESQTAEIARVSSDHFYGEMERIFIDLNRRGLIDVSDAGLRRDSRQTASPKLILAQQDTKADGCADDAADMIDDDAQIPTAPRIPGTFRAIARTIKSMVNVFNFFLSWRATRRL